MVPVQVVIFQSDSDADHKNRSPEALLPSSASSTRRAPEHKRVITVTRALKAGRSLAVRLEGVLQPELQTNHAVQHSTDHHKAGSGVQIGEPEHALRWRRSTSSAWPACCVLRFAPAERITAYCSCVVRCAQSRPMKSSRLNVRFGSFGDMSGLRANVRKRPGTGH
jgi:hypothetical protein